MVQSPSWEANWFAASQEIPRISPNPKVHYRTHKRSPPVSILGQPNPVHILTSHLLEIHPNIIHPPTPRSPQWSPPSGFSSKTLYTPSPHPYAPHTQPISFFSILSPAQYWVRSTNHLALRCAISSIPPGATEHTCIKSVQHSTWYRESLALNALGFSNWGPTSLSAGYAQYVPHNHVPPQVKFKWLPCGLRVRWKNVHYLSCFADTIGKPKGAHFFNCRYCTLCFTLTF